MKEHGPCPAPPTYPLEVSLFQPFIRTKGFRWFIDKGKTREEKRGKKKERKRNASPRARVFFFLIFFSLAEKDYRLALSSSHPLDSPSIRILIHPSLLLLETIISPVLAPPEPPPCPPFPLLVSKIRSSQGQSGPPLSLHTFSSFLARRPD